MIRLLRQMPDGYPVDWLLAALRSRRRLPSRHSAVMEREVLSIERRWIYGGLERRWRRRYAALFFWFELPALLVGLRQLAGREPGALQKLVNISLWPPRLLTELAQIEDLPSAAERLEREWRPVLPGIAGLGQTCRLQGPRGLEQQVDDAFFAALPAQKLAPELRRFFDELRTLRNLLTLQRLARWNLRGALPLYPGGVPVDRRLASDDPLQRQRAMRRLFGAAVDAPEDLERALLERLGQALQRREREDPRGALLLNSLWQMQMQTRRAGLRQWGGEALAAWEAAG